MPVEPPIPDRSTASRLRRAGRWLAIRYRRLIDAAIPNDQHSGDPDDLRRARIILGFSLVLVLLGIESAVFFSWALAPEAAFPISAALTFGLSLTAVIPLAFRRTHSLEVGANIVLFASYIVILTVLCHMGGIRSALLHWLGLLPMLAALMGARRSAWAWTAIGGATLAGLSAVEVAGWSFPNYMVESSVPLTTMLVQRSVDVGSWLTILLAIALLYEGHKTQQNRELARQNAALEREVAQRSRAEERTHYLAFYDELTALPNRRLFKNQLAAALESAAKRGRLVAVLFLDLDGFKQVNDALGHAGGDELLREVADRLKACVRLSDSVARNARRSDSVVSRLGGDEFTILLDGVRTPQEAARVARRILDCLERPVHLGGQEVFISGSIGIAIHPGEARDIDRLLRNADIAMYRAKEAGRNNFQFFDQSMNAEIVRRTTLATELRRAVDEHGLELHFQPILGTRDRRMTGVEALLRWNHPSRGAIPPDEFITVAEDTGLIVRLGDWVIGEACRQFREWREAGIAPERMAINVSGLQFRNQHIVRSAREYLERYDLPGHCIEFELTEHAMMIDEEETSRCLRDLKALGVRIALDDFGTGFSSLSYVRRYPVDSLKIDRSFVGDIDSDVDAQAIATAIIAMAHRLGLQVVGEGVETEAQENFLREHGCDEMQGYRFGHPEPAEQIAKRLAKARDGAPEEPDPTA